MSKSISANLKTHLQSQVTTLALLWKLTRQDGVVMGFTNHDEDIEYGGVTYESQRGMFSTALGSTANMAVDNAEVMAFLDSAKITLDDILAKKYDYATIDIYLINYKSTGDGVMILGEGWKVGEITLRDNRFHGEVRSKTQFLQQVIGDLYSPECRADVGDNRCGIILEPNDWQAETEYAVGDIVKATTYDGRRYVCITAGTSGTTEPSWDATIGNTTNDGTVVWQCYDAWTKQGMVTAVTSNRQFADTTTGWTEADDWWAYGKLTWLTGNNQNYEMEVKQWILGSKTFILTEVMPNNIQVGDTFKVHAGCDKRKVTCKDKFSNVVNMRAEPFVPGMDELMDYGTG